MRKAISSLFILFLLLLSLWGFSAWTFGNEIKESLQDIFSTTTTETENFLTNKFEIELLSSNHSIFGGKAKVSLQLSSQRIANYVGLNSDDRVILDIDFNNGPLFFDKSGVNFGRSNWHIKLNKETFNDQVIDTDFLSKFKLKQLPIATITVGFDKTTKYTIPIQSDALGLQLQGIYDHQTKEGFGEIMINTYQHYSEKFKSKIKNSHLNFTHSFKDSRTAHIEFYTDIPELSFQHQAMSKPINLELTSNGKLSLINNVLHSNTNISFKQIQKSIYPIQQGEIQFKLIDANLILLNDVIDGFGQLQNLHQQVEWVLQEQSEVPEGQDQIWLLQDNIKQFKAQLPALTSAFLMKDNQPIIEFSANVEHKKRPSTLIGKILPLSNRVPTQSLYESNGNLISSDDSFLSMFKAEAQVTLDEELESFLSSQLPITKPKFLLTYKQNKLLMQ